MMRLHRVGFFRELKHGDPEGPSLRAGAKQSAAPHEDGIVAYLRSGHIITSTSVVVGDCLDPAKGEVGVLEIATDGEWAWPTDLAYYVASYHVALPEDFILQMERRRWVVPRLSDADVMRAAAALRNRGGEIWPVVEPDVGAKPPDAPEGRGERVIDYSEAKRLVEEAINREYKVRGDQLIVIDSSTVEKDYGWVVFYESQRFMEHNDENYVIAGNAPLIVERDGTLHWLGTAQPVEEYLAAFEAQRRARGEAGR
jgi:hypothetical protein